MALKLDCLVFVLQIQLLCHNELLNNQLTQKVDIFISRMLLLQNKGYTFNQRLNNLIQLANKLVISCYIASSFLRAQYRLFPLRGPNKQKPSKLENLTLSLLLPVAIKNDQQANRCNCRCRRGWVAKDMVTTSIYTSRLGKTIVTK